MRREPTDNELLAWLEDLPDEKRAQVLDALDVQARCLRRDPYVARALERGDVDRVALQLGMMEGSGSCPCDSGRTFRECHGAG